MNHFYRKAAKVRKEPKLRTFNRKTTKITKNEKQENRYKLRFLRYLPVKYYGNVPSLRTFAAFL